MYHQDFPQTVSFYIQLSSSMRKAGLLECSYHLSICSIYELSCITGKKTIISIKELHGKSNLRLTM